MTATRAIHGLGSARGVALPLAGRRQGEVWVVVALHTSKAGCYRPLAPRWRLLRPQGRQLPRRNHLPVRPGCLILQRKVCLWVSG